VIEAPTADGVTIIYISHYLDEVFRLSNRIVVLRDGEVKGQFETSATSRDEVLTAMLGSELGELYPAKATMWRAADARCLRSRASLSRAGLTTSRFGPARRGFRRIRPHRCRR